MVAARIRGGNMFDYRRVMLAVDLTEESAAVSERAVRLAALSGADLHIVHVIEPLSLAYGGDIPMDLSTVQDQIHDQARSHLAEFAATLGISADKQHLIFGRPESEIQRTAESVGADVIVVGSHGRHGLALLLGSTANGVVHGATCDVLAVRVGQRV
jgi:universal stress protein A